MMIAQTGAVFDTTRTYRFSLFREFVGGARRTALFIGLNPSKAGEEEDDPTVRREMDFVYRWGFHRYEKVNLYAFRATDPKVLFAEARRTSVDEVIGPSNDETIVRLANAANRVVLAWGAGGDFADRGEKVLRLLWHLDLYCFGKTKSGQPKHPLYLPKKTKLIHWHKAAR